MLPSLCMMAKRLQLLHGMIKNQRTIINDAITTLSLKASRALKEGELYIDFCYGL